MRLIDADKLQEHMKKGRESGSNLNITYDLYIEQAPTIEINNSIDRQDAIEGVKELFACADNGNDECDITYMLENLPSTDRPTGKWIPVSKRLPDKEELVLVTDSGSIEFGKLICGLFGDLWLIWLDSCWEEATKVTAWMPLSEPYREDGE